MAISVKVYTNSDDATIVWRTDKRIADCRGFALYRQARDAAGNVTNTVVNTWVGFQNDPQARSGLHKPSTAWPIQRFLWNDYFARGAGQVRYRVVPMLGRAGGLQPAEESECSDWSAWASVATGQTAGFRAYFNRGIVASQWVARAVDNQSSTPTATLDQDIRDPRSKVRIELGGQLRSTMLDLLATAKARGDIIYAALFQLNDPELIPALIALGKNCNLILGSGPHKAGKDWNATVRKQMKDTGAINLYDRLVTGQHFAHNKFVVFCDAQGRPQRVWTGSTNWTVTGLCTEVNNGVLVQDPVIANAYLQRWLALKAAGNGYPKTLAESGSKPAISATANVRSTAWNAPVLKLVDLADARKLIRGAQQGVLFLMFNPGPRNTLLNDILALNEKKLFVHGVVNQDPGGKKAPLLKLNDRGKRLPPASSEVILPSAINDKMKGWFQKEFRYDLVMIHSKVVLIDPFGSHPVVMTGSHNLGPKASAKNDDNLLIIENASGLAAEYAVNILGVYGHYKWRYNLKVAESGTAKQKKMTHKWKGLVDDDKWQDAYYTAAKLREINFWFGTAAR